MGVDWPFIRTWNVSDGDFFTEADVRTLAAPDGDAADRYELVIMSRAEDLLPIQRELERERFGFSTT